MLTVLGDMHYQVVVLPGELHWSLSEAYVIHFRYLNLSFCQAISNHNFWYVSIVHLKHKSHNITVNTLLQEVGPLSTLIYAEMSDVLPTSVEASHNRSNTVVCSESQHHSWILHGSLKKDRRQKECVDLNHPLF